jgi:putative ABC transport system permease protein
MRERRGWTDLRESLEMAFDVLRTNPLRSFLTILGIMIGVTTLIAIGAVINGLNGNVLGQIQMLGSNTIICSRLPFATLGRLPAAVLQRKDIKSEWAEGISQLPHVTAAAASARIQRPELGAGSSNVRRGDVRAKGVILQGAPPAMATITNLEVERGRFFNETDEEHHSDVTVLGYDTTDTLFPGHEDPLGQEVLLEGTVFTVVGVLKQQKQALGTGQNPNDNIAMIPLSTLHKLHSEVRDFVLFVAADDGKNMPLVVEEVREYVRRMRRLPSDSPDDFEVLTTDTFLDLWKEISNGIFIVMMAVGSVALLVGGIGVMNIMLVSVTERTREIGVRKAVGARRINILTQFLLEATTLASTGGIIGVLLGWILVVLMRLAFPSFPATVSLTLVIIGVSVAGAIGIFFGVYPAWKASQLNPVDALRYE